MTPEELHFSPRLGPAGNQSPRCYTITEIRAAKRLGALDGAPRRPESWGGPIFWATGEWWPNELERRGLVAARTIRDVEKLLAAMGREWGKEWS